MLPTGLFAALYAGLMLLSPISQRAEARSPANVPLPSSVIEAQWPGGPGYPPPDPGREHCDRLRQILDEIQYRMQFAQQRWQRDRAGTRYYQIRERLRVECGM
jgi:hypothetical protein